MNIDENTQLANQLETFKQGNHGVKATIEDLKAKNTDYAEELENLLSILKEHVNQNTELDVQAEHLVDANMQLGEECRWPWKWRTPTCGRPWRWITPTRRLPYKG